NTKNQIGSVGFIVVLSGKTAADGFVPPHHGGDADGLPAPAATGRFWWRKRNRARKFSGLARYEPAYWAGQLGRAKCPLTRRTSAYHWTTKTCNLSCSKFRVGRTAAAPAAGAGAIRTPS